MSRSMTHFILVAICFLSISMVIPKASAIEPYLEYRKQVEKAESIEGLTPDLMGDQVSRYDGSTRFEVTDIDLPGNNALPVRLTRSWSIELSFVTALPNTALGGIGNWTIAVPYIEGTFDARYDWKGSYAGGGLDVTDRRCSKKIYPKTSASFMINDIWQGNTVNVPGQQSRVMLTIEDEYPPALGGTGQTWTTKEQDHFTCIPMKSGLTGEGFLMTDKNGLKYYFDTAVSRVAGEMKSAYETLNGRRERAIRVRRYILASRIEDRYGNYVNYSYNGNGHPVTISSSDGRVIELVYSDDKLTTAIANGRSWKYAYEKIFLTDVTRPDGSTWIYQEDGYGNTISDVNETLNPRCFWDEALGELNLTIGHPSGAIGKFEFTNIRHFRSGVPQSYCVHTSYNRGAGIGEEYIVSSLQAPYYWDVMSLRRKEITGAGLKNHIWSYRYDTKLQPLWGGNFRNGPCAPGSCVQEKTNSIFNPDGTRTLTRFGIVLAGNEAREIGGSTLAADGTVMRSYSNHYLSDADAAGQPFNAKWGNGPGSLSQNEAQVRPIISRETIQDGVIFRSSVNTGCTIAGKLCADKLARPTLETQSNTLGYSRTRKTEYYDNTAVWVLGQTKRSWVDNILTSETSYSSATALPLTIKRFGKLEQTLTYNSDGTLATVKDGNGNVTALSSWKRGTPQLIGHADGTSESAVVDANGWLSSVKDENGYVTTYAYDAMGRITQVTPPEGNPTTQSFAPSTTARYGLPVGYWIQITDTGKARKVRHFDAMWRPVLEEAFDNTNSTTLAATHSLAVTRYDESGRPAFQSYPLSSLSSINDASLKGTWTFYDALGRTTAVSQDSELGLLTTLTDYLPGFKTRTTDPNKGYTTTSYQVFDEPTMDFPVLIEQPEGVDTWIKRDVFGKPLEITR